MRSIMSGNYYRNFNIGIHKELPFGAHYQQSYVNKSQIFSKKLTLISPPTRPRVVNENFSLSTNKFSGLKEIPIFHINDKSTLHPIYYLVVYRTEKITIVVPTSEIKFW